MVYDLTTVNTFYLRVYNLTLYLCNTVFHLFDFSLIWKDRINSWYCLQSINQLIKLRVNSGKIKANKGLLISGTFCHFLFPMLDILTTLIAKMKQIPAVPVIYNFKLTSVFEKNHHRHIQSMSCIRYVSDCVHSFAVIPVPLSHCHQHILGSRLRCSHRDWQKENGEISVGGEKTNSFEPLT